MQRDDAERHRSRRHVGKSCRANLRRERLAIRELVDRFVPGLAATGALGSVPAHVFRDIRAVVGDAKPVTAALGDPTDPIATERAAQESARVSSLQCVAPGPSSA